MKKNTYTPICDFVRKYKRNNLIRAHVPGHKGKSFLGCESLDITEIDGADELYSSNGIIKESENIASSIFGCHTYYSTEGSSLVIRGMIYLVKQYALLRGKSPKILTTRNVHKSFLTGVGLANVEVEWIYDQKSNNFISCDLTSEHLHDLLNGMANKPTALYLTSPDYLGGVLDIKSLAKVCHEFGVLLIVDNAHGAYLRFLTPSLHPIDLGADMCCDSAHKTLPVLTGGAYLHLSSSLPKEILSLGKTALSIFASTSPSYLILQSLDNANKILTSNFKNKLSKFIKLVENLKQALLDYGYSLLGNDKLKIVIDATKIGYSGKQLADVLKSKNIFIEFADCDYIVLMLTPFNSKAELNKIKNALLSVKLKESLRRKPQTISIKTCKLTCTQVLNCVYEEMNAQDSIGKIYADFNLPCPPAVPTIMPGEVIDEEAINTFTYYGINKVKVVKQK